MFVENKVLVEMSGLVFLWEELNKKFIWIYVILYIRK